MAGSTFDFIVSYTVSSAENNIVLDNIPQNFTDLVIIGKSKLTSSASQSNLRFNGDGSPSYDLQQLSNNGGSGMIGNREYNRQQIDGAGAIGSTNTTGWFGPNEYHIFNYSDPTKHKTVLCFGLASDSANVLDYCAVGVSTWAKKSPITKITILTNGTAFAIGSSWSIYGIRGK